MRAVRRARTSEAESRQVHTTYLPRTVVRTRAWMASHMLSTDGAPLVPVPRLESLRRQGWRTLPAASTTGRSSRNLATTPIPQRALAGDKTFLHRKRVPIPDAGRLGLEKGYGRRKVRLLGQRREPRTGGLVSATERFPGWSRAHS